MTEEILVVDNLNKNFGAFHVIKDVSFAISEGDSWGLVGPNGSGKSTLFDLICGYLPVSSGEVRIEGQVVTRLDPHLRFRLGLGRTFQLVELFSGMTVLEHLKLAMCSRRREFPLRSLLRRNTLTNSELAEAFEILEILDITDEANSLVDTISLGHARLVEVARAMALGPRIILLDEPSSGLDPNESKRLAEALRQLRKERSISILLVEHDLEFLSLVVEKALLLAEGELVMSGELTEITRSLLFRELYLGQ